MITLALFNNKGGVGKTTLTYHLAHMLARVGYRVLAVDLDPQANLTAACLDQEVLEQLWIDRGRVAGDVLSGEPALFSLRTLPDGAGTIADSVRPHLANRGDVQLFEPLKVVEGLHLVPGDLELGSFEDRLSQEWSNAVLGTEGALRVTSDFHRVIRDAGRKTQAEVALIDVGPNLGAINRAALLAADHVLMPLAADLFSLRGLNNLGPQFREWRKIWNRMLDTCSTDAFDFEVPQGRMQPIGYVIMQPAMRLNQPLQAYERWLKRIPVVYSEAVLDEKAGPRDTTHQIGTVRNFQSLMPLSHDANKPMFDLRAGDGAIGGSTMDFVRLCYTEFHELALAIAERLGLPELDA